MTHPVPVQRTQPVHAHIGRAAPYGVLAAAVLAVLYGSPSRAAPAPDPAPGGESVLTDVTVTANRHSASAQDIPLSITAVSGAAIESAGIEDMSSLARSMAGVNVTDKGPFGGVNGSTLIIRGLNSEATAGQLALATPVVPPVATYVDNTPLFVNLRLQDLDHVEVLRGPQGTLYGSGSLGGTIRFVQNAPNTAGFDASVQAGLSKTSHTHALNDDLSAMLNIPLSPTFAIRINASLSDDAGFINQPNLYRLDASGAPIAADPTNLLSAPATYAKDGTNHYGYRSARVAALWKPEDGTRVGLTYYHQSATASGFPYASPLYGVDALTSTDVVQESTEDKVDLVSLSIEHDFGFATLTSDTSVAHHTNTSFSDLTSLYSNFPFYPSLYGMNPRVLVTGHDGLDDKPIVEELRLASKPGSRLDWVTGLFYKSQKTNIVEHEFYPGYLDYFNACTPVYGVSNGDGVTPSQCGIGETAYTPGVPNVIEGVPIVKDQAYIGDFETTFKDLALFGELTGHLTDAWTLTGGARVFRQTVSQSQQTGLLFDGIGSIANVSLSDSWRRALWKINTAYQFDPHNLVYATWSQGFRRGGVNALPAAEPAVGYTTDPGLYKLQPDKADNYEIGFKGTVGTLLRYSAAVFDVQWHNVQEGAQLTPLVLPGAVNVGDAFSRGLETELYLNLSRNWSVQADYTYDQTRLTSLSPLAVAGLAVPPPAVGSPMPGTPKSSAAVTLQYAHLPLAGGELDWSASAHYQSSLIPALSATIPTVAAYTMVSTRLNYRRGHWNGALYVNNLTNQVGVNSYSDPQNYANHYQALVSQPRTYGLSFGYSWNER